MNRTTLPRSLLLCAALAACAPGASTDPAGTVTGTIEYAGAEVGTLRVAVFSSFPPRGAPVAEVAIEAPSFPQPYTIRGVPPGRYFVLALIDTNVDDGDRYRPRVDPGGTFGPYRSPAAITLQPTRAAGGVDIELVAPTPSSPWDR